MPNRYKCSNGELVTDATIKQRRSRVYRELYEGNPHPNCAGCGAPAEGSAHLIPQKVAKESGMSELCWTPINIVPACHKCNSILESYKSEKVKKLRCYDRLLEITRKYLPERYNKMIL